MATNVKCMWIFQSNQGYGWTEIHYLSVGAVPPINLTGILDLMDSTISPTRRALLGTDCAIIGDRASDKTTTGIASLNRVVSYPGNMQEPSGSQNDSLATVMIDTSNTRKKIIHIRGMWDSVIEREQYLPNLPPGTFGKLMSKYQASLIAQKFGWLGKDPANSVFGTVSNYTQGAGDQITFTVQPTVGSAALNTLITNTSPPTFECRFSKLNRSSSVLNRTFVVQPVVAGTPPAVTGLQTVNPVAAGPFIAPGRFNISIPLFIQYAVAGSVSAGERRMGKALYHYPGRSRRRPEI